MASTLDKRIELDNILRDVCPNVYFAPPTGKQLEYPCIVYSRSYAKANFADNAPYILDTRYMLQVFDLDPDSEIVHKVEQLPKCTYDRNFVSDNVNCDVFTIYY